MRVLDYFRTAAQRLADAGIPDPAVDVELLIGHVCDQSRGEVQARMIRGDVLDVKEHAAIETLVVRRAAREPLQHLTGTAPFRHLTLHVGPGVFVPRPETETVTQFAIDHLLNCPVDAPVAVDLCTGSGAIALAIATEVPHSRVFAAELSPEAFVWTTRNAGAQPNLTLANVDLVDAFPELDGRVDVVISNPPYVPDGAIPRDPEVRLFDPPLALYGGADGLDIVRVLSQRALALARPGGLVVIEHGELQGADIRQLLQDDGWRSVSTHRDLTQRDRATTGIRG